MILNKPKEIGIAAARMVLQLVAVGFALAFLFEYTVPWIGLTILSGMILVATTIAVRPIKKRNRIHFLCAGSALCLSSTFNLSWILFAVLRLDPWYQPQMVIPLAGMVFSTGMNAISIAAERFEQEEKSDWTMARNRAYNAAMIPQINALLAVGLVSLPGMMTGQILSGVSPLVAVRYQILVMSMVSASSTLSIVFYFYFLKRLSTRTD